MASTEQHKHNELHQHHKPHHPVHIGSSGGGGSGHHHQQHQHHHHQHHLQSTSSSTSTSTNTTITNTSTNNRALQQQPKEDNQIQASMSNQQKHALHRLRRLKKRSPHRDLVISFVPRLRTSIIDRLDFFHRYSKQEQEVLSCFDFLDELVSNYCDENLNSPRYSQKFYQSMIHGLIY